MLQYSQAKENLLGIIERLSGSVRVQTCRAIATVKAKLEEEAFNLVILGQFKRGKSTFINALLGENILPTAIVPLTSVVTILRYGPTLRIEVHYQNASPPVETGPRCADSWGFRRSGEVDSSDLSDSPKDASKASF